MLDNKFVVGLTINVFMIIVKMLYMIYILLNNVN